LKRIAAFHPEAEGISLAVMKAIFTLGFGILLLAGQGLAQKTLPPPPGYPGKPRTTGGTGGVQILPRDDSREQTKYTTRIMLSDSRSWTSSDGKLLEGRLIAFEDLVVEAPKGAEPPAPPKPPEKPTVIRDGKIRLQLANRKIVEIPLDRLSEADREFVAHKHKTYREEPPPP
jgi:hypothetical protein